MKTLGLIAAAGQSSRMGRAKALLPVPPTSVPLAAHLAKVFVDGGIDDVVITLPKPPDAHLVEAHLLPHVEALTADSNVSIRCVQSAHWDRGLIGSIQTAIAMADATVTTLVFTPVDAPFTTPDLVQTLTGTLAASNADAALPLVGQQTGHPVAVARSLFADLCRPAPDGARGVLAGASTVSVPWHQARVVDNINTPAAWSDVVAALKEQ